MLLHQLQAIQFVGATAFVTSPEQIQKKVKLASLDSSFDRDEYERLANRISCGFPVDVHFHPDRIVANGLTVVEALVTSRVYENQFATGVSNGALSVALSGKRRLWESRMFGATYDAHPDADRPKYGALNLFDTQDGACPRFGSCYLRLRPEISRRCTLSYGDSHVEPAARGTPGTPGPLLVALLCDFTDKTVDLDVNTSIAQHARRLRQNPSPSNTVVISQGRILDGYIEVQLHGVLSLSSDVLYLSADAAFQGTQTGVELIKLAKTCKIDLIWRPALVLPAGPIPTSFRGNALTCFVESIRKSGQIDVAHLGELARSVVSEPDSWSAWGSEPDVLQLIKQTWHAMVAFGELDSCTARE